MSYEEAEEFVRVTLNDEELREELDDRLDSPEASDVDEARNRLMEVAPEFAAEHGYDFTAEEGLEALEALGASLESKELSDEELDRVAGGKLSTADFNKMGSGLTVGVYCAIASIAYEANQSGGCGAAYEE